MRKIEKSRQITEEEINFLYGLDCENITLETLDTMFANKKSSKAKFNTYDWFDLPAGKKFNKTKIRTTVGRYLFNTFLLTPELGEIIGYQNTVLDGDGIGDLDSLMAKLLLEDTITSEIFIEYIDRMQWLGFNLAKIINTSMTTDLLLPPESVERAKKKLVQQYKKEIEKGDVVKFNEIEKTLINMAKDELKDCPDYEIYASGARGKFNNSYKNSTIFRGGLKNLAQDGKYYISTNSLLEGIPPEESGKYADLMTQASYLRAIATREGGYEAKKLSAAFQNIVLDDKGTDCGTKRTRVLTIDKGNKGMLLYRYIVEGGKLKLLTPDNIGEYLGKTVHMRSPLYCTSEKYCNVCSGEQYYMMDNLRNVGLLTNRVGTSLLNAALKGFHDMSLKIVDIDIDKFIE